MSRFRAEVTSYEGGTQRTWVVYCDPDELSEDQKAIARPIVARAIREMATLAGQTEPWACELLFAMAVERFADLEAYEREVARRSQTAIPAGVGR